MKRDSGGLDRMIMDGLGICFGDSPERSCQWIGM